MLSINVKVTELLEMSLLKSEDSKRQEGAKPGARLVRSNRRPEDTVKIETLLSNELLENTVAPMNQDELEWISAEEAKGLLCRGEPLVRRRISGDLILGQENLAYPIEVELKDGRKVVLSGMPGPPAFTRRKVASGIEIVECLCEGRVNFAGLWFKEPVHISGTTFCADVTFQHSTFDKTAAFYRSRFEGKATISDTTFLDLASFDFVTFAAKADFYNGLFQQSATFKGARFEGSCNFSQSTFQTVTMAEACLGFGSAVCCEAALFSDAKFDGIADFTGTQFRRHVEFSKAKFRYVNFKGVEFGSRVELKWEQISNNKLLFGDIELPGFDVGKPTLTLDELEDLFQHRVDAPLPEKHRQYDILKGIFEKQGDYVSADPCLYEWKQIERKQSRLTWNPESWVVKAFHYLNWLSCGYGIKPIRAVLFALVLIFIFTLAYLAVDPTISQFLSYSDTPRAESIQPFTEALKNLKLSFTTFMGFGGADATLNPISQILFLTERLLGWLTLLLFFATYTRILLR